MKAILHVSRLVPNASFKALRIGRSVSRALPFLDSLEHGFYNLFDRPSRVPKPRKMPLVDPVTMASANPSTRALPEKTTLPIELLPTDLARTFSQVHPVLLLSAYYLRFPSFVADPVPTLLSSLLPLALIQIAYSVVCLPAVGTNNKSGKRVKPHASKKSTEGYTAKILTITFALLLTLVSVPLLTALQILFGAPVTTHIPHTVLSSAHLALLAIFPLVYVHGSDGTKWREIASLYSPVDEVFGGAVGCFFGAWLGAVPIPLDWDREWQKWPVTIVTGAYAGYMVGKVVGGWLLKGKRIELD